jgi:hypothetical protein
MTAARPSTTAERSAILPREVPEPRECPPALFEWMVRVMRRLALEASEGSGHASDEGTAKDAKGER